MKDQYDVVVVGARVAGSATALHLARAGHRVALLDRAGPPADTTSTHALIRTGVLQLRRTGVLDRIIAAGTPPVRRVDLVFGPEHVSFPVVDAFGVDTYYAPRRTILDTILLEAAVEAGVEFHPDVSITGVSRDDTGRVNGTFARTGEERDTWVRARHVVGADGSNSRVARSVDAAILRQRRPNNAMVYGYFAGVEAAGYDFRFVEHRNVGVVPTNDDLTLVFAGGPIAQAHADGERYLMSTLGRVAPELAEAVGAGARTERLHRANGITSILRDPAGPGWSLVGDAGFTEDPISAHGISDALRDAELCAEAVDTALRDPAAEAEGADLYRRTRNRFAVPLIETAIRLASFDWDEQEASRLLRQIGDVSEAECRFLSERQSATLPAA